VTIRFTLALHLVSVANVRENWRKRGKRAGEHVAQAMHASIDRGIRSLVRESPQGLRVTITRIGPRDLDDDNLAISGKSVRDGIARAAGVDDGKKWWTWAYDQRRARREESLARGFGVEVTIEQRVPDWAA
jgi:hypothetical protein